MTSITLDEFLKKVETCDLLLYSSKKWYSKVIEYFSRSKFSHISILLKEPVYLNPNLKGLYVLESGYEKTPDPTDGKYKFGVQITPLNDVIQSYQKSWGTLYHRKLHCLRDDNFEKMMKRIYDDVYDKPYDMNICDWIKAAFKIDIGNEKKTNTFWCSALIAYVYSQMSFLKNVLWTIVSPKEFSYYEDNESLEFINCTLDPEKYIIL